jgi:hypothetical protein
LFSHSRNDLDAAADLGRQLERRGLTVFRDDGSVGAGGP